MIINVPFKKLKHIVQVADVHIRLFRRHEEYQAAFDRLYEDIRSKNLEDFVIVLVGDIVHAKTDMSPEMVDITSRFLTSIADIAPTILIAGNHDSNLANSNRLDALTPIVNNLKHPDLYYARESTFVHVADSVFAVHSVFDEQDNWPDVADIDDNVANRIALYHGPVHGATTDTNFVITNRHLNVDRFNGYHMVLLGDIHRTQILQQYDEARGKPIVSYVGSLIQQNHGESIDGHGWKVWDVPSRTYEFIPLHNDYGYCTLEVINGKITLPPVMPNKVRMRLFTGDSETTEIKKIITALRNKFNIIELSVNRSRLNKMYDRTTNLTHHESLDLTSVSVQNELISKWLEKNYSSLDSDVMAAIQKINVELNNRIQHEDQSRNIHWRPLTFKFSNMFSYGDSNEIDFTDMTGVYGLFAPNASGKSSIMDALMFCLYDKTPRAFKGDHIINNRKDNFECELSFEINEERYGIRRVGTRKKNGDVKVDVEFWRVLPNNEIVSLNGEDRRSTNANIRNYVGTYEDFIMTAFSGQTNNALFIDKSHSERKDLLIQFMGLNVFDKLHDAAHGEAKEIIGVLRRFKKSDVTDEIATTHLHLTDMKNLLTEAEARVEALAASRGALEGEVKDLHDKKLPVPATSGNLAELNTHLTALSDKYIKNTQSLVAVGNRHNDVITEVNEYRKDLQQYDMVALEQSVSNYTKLFELHKKGEQALKVVSTKLEEKIKFRNKLQSYKYNPDCSVCVENNKSVIDDLNSVAAEIVELENKVAAQQSAIDEIKNQLEPLATDKDNYDRALELVGKISHIEENVIPKIFADTELVKVNIWKIDADISTTKNEIETYKANAEALEFNADIQTQITVLEGNIEKINNDISSQEKTIRTLHGNVSVLEAKKEDLTDKLKEAEELEISYEAYNHYMIAVGRDGIPYDLISKAIPQIEGEINSILSQLVDFTISLDMDGKNINGKLIYDYDRIWPLENSSGMERFVSSLAIRVALMNVSNLPKPNFMMIDEGFTTLDADHIHTMQTLFSLLKSHFDFILIVSHLDAMRDMVDNIIEIKKEDGYSSIVA
jgi:DNA repair exonuclease SbcCD ATPase subunit/predicted MPP superfamily phosphohydrolase